jgi:DNA-binding winged helix-turn-helix (wHTH) protein
MNHTQGCKLFTLITLFVGVLVVGPAAAHRWSDWSEAVPVTEINTPTAGEGCAIESPNGLNLYIASNRPGGLGGNDIWVAERDSINEPWGSVQNLGSPVNSVANDFCPTPLPGHWLFFVSERPGPNTCNAGPGKGDIYLIRKNPAHGWGEPLNLGCVADGTDPNSIGAEFSPSFVETSAGAFLYFSSDGGSDGGAQVSHDTLRRGGDLVAIEPRVLDVLIYLLINRERVITKDELLDKFWPGQVVSETALTRCIVAARKAVGDDGAKQAIIETQRGRGYRFIAPVATIAAPVLSAESRVPSQSEEVSRKEAEANQKAKEENGLKSSVQSLASEDHKRIVTSHPLDPRPVTLDNAAPARSWSIRPLLLIGLLLLVGIITAVQYLSLPTPNPQPPTSVAPT